MADVTIHGSPFSTYVRTARMACVEKGASYELAEADLKADDYVRLHPFRKMPVLQHGDLTIYETSAIARYIDETFSGGPALVPDTAAGRALMEQWVSTINAYLYPTLIRGIVFERIVAPMMGGQANEDTIKAALPEAERQLKLIDAHMAEHKWLAGDDCTIADLMLAPVMFYVSNTPEGKAILGGCANIQRAGGEMFARKSFAETMPPMPQAAE
ncbi:MAG: glutathione S-transferase family protein [Alphaproteobacteria bacterium]